ncbi:unnamed protein product, partial [Brenthis ino]
MVAHPRAQASWRSIYATHILRRLVFQSTRHAKGESLSPWTRQCICHQHIGPPSKWRVREETTYDLDPRAPKQAYGQIGLDRSPYVFVLSS